ncbi:MAG: alpha/beta hydrolase [Deltaproteobacteria bacterium]|nr:alpha/beta hydrolase [Deltaproteobacteria bacterium]
MYEQPRWPREALVPILGGLVWLWCAASFGLVGFLFSLIPGVLLLASGTSLLFWPGDDRITHFAALGGLLGVPLALPVFFTSGFWLGALLAGFSAASFVAAGIAAIRQEPHAPGVPTPPMDVPTAAQVAIDEVLLSTMVLTRDSPWGRERERILREAQEARTLFASRGWLDKPTDYHRNPPALDEVQMKTGRTLGIDFEEWSFESGYEPGEDEPCRDRWLSYERNRTAYARVLRSPNEGRPWVVCIHGYQMGWPLTDVGAFRDVWRKRDLNVLLPVLPLHGPRKMGRRSGDGFLDGDVLNSVHAEAQAMWDMRRMLSYLRGTQGAEKIGAYGLSLGGYNTALLASLDGDLACAIAGIPAVDFSRLMWRHGAPLELMSVEHAGMEQSIAEDVLKVISPLSLEPRVPKEHRAIFAGTADRLVPPDQVADLWRHWGEPRIHWYHGAHMTFMLDPGVGQLIGETFSGAGLG